MPICTFFGHRDCPESIRGKLREAVEWLIREKNVVIFYVGNQGRFDAMALGVLRELRQEYPHIRYGVVLAYPPKGPVEPEAMYPEGLETVPPRYAISRRNDWMLRQTDYVITYITHSWGGAAQYGEKARKQGKYIFPLAPDFQQNPPNFLSESC